ncbi:MAG TPA: phosphatidylserine/phosphatidylglycerophosphate/cardiolipin synthase family protein [Sphingomicrobium sp.]|nr:phosphatidylserine/phosphatidylglycerophosphate/cardiolipin synthase family protein [Sphingomicrobium sp.]
MTDRPFTSGRQARQSPAATVDGNALTLVETGSERMRTIIEIIESATSSIRMLFYMFSSESSGATVRDALVEAAKRGVRVKLLLDGYGCSSAEANFFKDIGDAGGDFCLFHPSYGRRYLLRNHQKLVISDEGRALIGGANIEDSYLVDEGERYWRDLWLMIEGPAVRGAVDYFDELYSWTINPHARLRDLRGLVFRHSQSSGALQWKFSGPLSRRNPWPAALARDLTGGHRLDLIAAYFAPPRSMLRRLGRLARRGAVRIVTASKSDNNATIAAARHTYARLLRRGIEMYEYQPTRLHTKLIVVDDVVYIGSANFDFRSFYLNLEIMLRIQDPAFARRMRGYFETELADSERITPGLHRRRAHPWSRFKWTVSHWLVTSMDYTVTRRLNFRVER